MVSRFVGHPVYVKRAKELLVILVFLRRENVFLTLKTVVGRIFSQTNLRNIPNGSAKIANAVAVAIHALTCRSLVAMKFK